MEMAATRPRILLVDDEPSVVKMLAAHLEKEFQVVPAFDGEEALVRFRQGEFDLILLDLMLPKKNGLDVCRELRESSSVPIIMLTAKADESDKIYGLELGADDYITKPFSPLELRSRIRAAPAADRRAQPARHRRGRAADRQLQADGHEERRADPADQGRVRDPLLPGREPGAGLPRARSCSSTSGTAPPIATCARSTFTSDT